MRKLKNHKHLGLYHNDLNDIKIALENFQGVTINIFINNGTVIERDNELVKWFIEKYSYLALDDRVELLLDNKDLGVFEQ